jgi:tetratricopeptide (TPR) repeat protein
VEIAFEQALVARFSGRLEEALELCRRATERDPRNPNVYNTRGLVLHFLGRYPEALAAFNQSAALNYEGIPNTNRARTILRAEGDAAKALREYESIALGKFGQFDPQMRVDKMEILLAAGRYADALAEIDRFEQPAALSQWGYYIRTLLAARVREVMGEAEDARRGYTEALPIAVAFRSQHPRSWRAYPPVAQAAAGLGQKDEALAAVREAMKLVPPAENPYYAQIVTLPLLVEIQARFGMMDDALVVVREQIAAGWWRRNDLRLGPQFFFARKDPRFRELAEKAPL